jgi:hypothetical protein
MVESFLLGMSSVTFLGEGADAADDWNLMGDADCRILTSTESAATTVT